MPEICVHVSGFGGTYAHLDGSGPEQLTVSDVWWASTTVGEASIQDVRNRTPRDQDYHFAKALLLDANLDFGGQQLVPATEFDERDPSEKSMVSYCMGMAFAKLWARWKLDVSWLQHVDPLLKQPKRAKLTSGKSRPDLAGLDKQGDWHVFEAKGRSSGTPSRKDWKEWKDQAKNVATIDNHRPVTRCVSVALAGTTPITLEVQDPADSRDSGEAWDFSREEFLDAYYQPVLAYLSPPQVEAGRWSGVGFRFVTLLLADRLVRIAIPEVIAENPAGAFYQAPDLVASLEGSVSDHSGDLTLGGDGVLVEVRPKGDMGFAVGGASHVWGAPH